MGKEHQKEVGTWSKKRNPLWQHTWVSEEGQGYQRGRHTESERERGRGHVRKVLGWEQELGEAD